MPIFTTECLSMSAKVPNKAINKQRRRALFCAQRVIDSCKAQPSLPPQHSNLIVHASAAIIHLALPTLSDPLQAYKSTPFLATATFSLSLLSSSPLHPQLILPAIQILDYYCSNPNHTDSMYENVVAVTSYLKAACSSSTSDLSLFIKSAPSPFSSTSPTVAAALNSTLAFATNSFSSYSDTSPENTSQILHNVLSTFRVLANSSDKQIKKSLLKLKVPVTLCSILHNLPDARNAVAVDSSVATLPDHALHAARALGRLSLQEPMRNLINSDPHHLRDLLRLLTYWSDQAVMGQYSSTDEDSKQSTHLNIVLRVAFALGNLTASNDSNRKLLVSRFGGAKAIPACLSGVAAIYMKEAMEPTPTRTSLLADSLVKLTRLIANVCINREAGLAIACADGIDSLSTLLMVVIEADEQELLLNVVSAITNLSFYGKIDVPSDSPPSPSSSTYQCQSKIFSRREEICSCLVGVLLHENQSAVVEAARAFGNFSRDEIVRSVIVAARGDEAMALLLQQNANDEVTYAIVGCLVNLAASPKHNRVLTGEDSCSTYETVFNLIRKLRFFGLKKIQLSAVVCKVIHNLSYGCGGANLKFASCFHSSPPNNIVDNIALLRDTLLELLDVAEDARQDEIEEVKGGDEEEELGGARESKYDEFIATGNALLSVVKDTIKEYEEGGEEGGDHYRHK